MRSFVALGTLQDRSFRFCAGRVLGAYPDHLRGAFAAELVETAIGRLHDVRRDRGLAAAQLWALRELGSLVLAGVEARRELGRATRLAAPGRQGLGADLGLDSALVDLRTALRRAARRPGTTVLCVVLLGLGVGISASTMQVVGGLRKHIVPFPEPDRLVHVWTDRGPPGTSHGLATEADLRSLRRDDSGLEAVSALWMISGRILGGARPVHADVARVSAGFFDLLGVEPALGQAFPAGSDRPGAPWVAILSHEYWVDELGSDPDVLGRQLTIGWPTMRVIGVLPAGFRFDVPDELGDYASPAIWIPWWHGAGESSDVGSLAVVARVRDDFDAEGAAAGLARGRPGPKWTTEPLRSAWLEPLEPTLVLLTLASAFTLVLAVVNVMLLLRGSSPARELRLHVQRALGGSRGRLARPRVIEVLTLALAAWLVAWPVGAAYLRTFFSGAPNGTVLPDGPWSSAGPSGSALAVALLCGVALWGGGRLASFGPSSSRHGRAGTTAGRRSRPASRGRFLVALQVALSIPLVVGAALVYRTGQALDAIDLGFEPRDRYSFSIYLMDDYPELSDRTSFHDDLARRLESIPSVRLAAGTSALPLSRGLPHVVVAGPAAGRDADLLITHPGYFAATGSAVLDGRDFVLDDRAGAPPVVIVDRATASDWYPPGTAVGRTVVVAGQDRTIVGVVAPPKQGDLRDAPRPQVYVPYAQAEGGRVQIVVEVVGDAQQAWGSIRRAVAEIDPLVPTSDFVALGDRIRAATAQERSLARFLASFSLLSVCFVALGLLGVLSDFVRHSQDAIAIRMTVGGSRAQVIRLVLGRAVGLALPGLLTGIVAALVLGAASRELLYGVSPLHVGSLMTGVAVVLVAVLTSAFGPAAHAASIDPARTLRLE